MRDMAVGTDDEDVDPIVTEQTLDTILSRSDIPHKPKAKKPRPKKEKEELMVDRI
jgi:hypothetical protein